jgi:transposase
MRDRGELAFPGHGREALTEEQQKIRDLEKRLRDAEMEHQPPTRLILAMLTI